jgi:sulfite exporter TauE/SafE
MPIESNDPNQVQESIGKTIVSGFFKMSVWKYKISGWISIVVGCGFGLIGIILEIALARRAPAAGLFFIIVGALCILMGLLCFRLSRWLQRKLTTPVDKV